MQTRKAAVFWSDPVNPWDCGEAVRANVGIGPYGFAMTGEIARVRNDNIHLSPSRVGRGFLARKE